MLGAVGFSPEQLEIELNWIDEHIGDHPYGVDIVIPNKYEGMDADMSTEDLTKMLQDMVPQAHLDFARNLLIDHGVPLQEGEDDNTLQLLGWTEATATPQVEIALRHPKMTLIANALGTPPEGHDRPHPRRGPQGRGAVRLALPGAASTPTPTSTSSSPRAARAAATAARSARSCCGPRSSRPWRPVPVLAAGGIGSGEQIAAALALGCQGAWSGSQWLMVEESENTPVQQQAYINASSRDTVRSRSFTGKPCRMLKNDWTEAWEDPENPDPLGMPLQYMVSGVAVAATHRWPDQTVDVAFNPVGQVVGQFEKVEKTAAVIERWVNEYLEATAHLDELNAAAAAAG